MDGWKYTPEFTMDGMDPKTVKRTGDQVGWRHESGARVAYGPDHLWHATTASNRHAGRHVSSEAAMVAALGSP